jgi:hypothetical protein
MASLELAENYFPHASKLQQSTVVCSDVATNNKTHQTRQQHQQKPSGVSKMKYTTAIAAVAFAFGAFAQPAFADDSLSGKVMKDLPANTSGTTTNPTARPTDNSVSGKVMKELPANKRGSTANPTAKPADNSLSGEAMKDLPGNN